MCDESRVFEIGNNEAIAAIKQANMLSEKDIIRLAEFLTDPINFSVAFESEIGNFLVFAKRNDCRIIEVQQISD